MSRFVLLATLMLFVVLMPAPAQAGHGCCEITTCHPYHNPNGGAWDACHTATWKGSCDQCAGGSAWKSGCDACGWSKNGCDRCRSTTSHSHRHGWKAACCKTSCDRCEGGHRHRGHHRNC